MHNDRKYLPLTFSVELSLMLYKLREWWLPNTKQLPLPPPPPSLPSKNLGIYKWYDPEIIEEVHRDKR